MDLSLDINVIRDRLEAMTTEELREIYETRSGIRTTPNLTAILNRYRDLARQETIAEIEARRAAAGNSDEGRRLGQLHEAMVMCLETFRMRELSDRSNQLEATLTVQVNGEIIPFRELQGRTHAASDRDLRRKYHRAWTEALAGPILPLHREAIGLARQVATDLGHADYVEFVVRTSGIDLDRLRDRVVPILERTAGRQRELMSDALRRTSGVALADAESHDASAVMRASAFDHRFPAGGEAPLARELVERGLGLDLTAGGRIRLDLEPRPSKNPRAFCAPVRVPAEIYLVTKPSGGLIDYITFFHELGHALHLAHTDASHPVEYRRFGDNSVTEGFAVLMDGILRERAWAERHLGSDLEPYLEHAALRDLWMYRRYAAKLAYELEFWRTPETGIESTAERYVAHLGAAALIPVDRERYLADIDPHFYVARYLRAWLFAALLRSRLHADFGEAWFTSRRAGRFLRELWSYGQKYDAEELARELGTDGLSAEPLIEEVEALVR
jgi:hypothetical protein